MTNFSNLTQAALAAVGAIILSSTAVGAAVGPAHLIESGPALNANSDAGAARA